MLRSGLFSKIITNNINQANLSRRNVCLEIGVNITTNLVEDEDDAEATPKELLD